MINHEINDEKKAARSQVLGYIGIAGTLGFAGIILLLHGLQPPISIVYDAMSYYVYGRQGWLLPASLLVLGIGSAALAAGLFRTFRSGRSTVGSLCIAVWSLGLILAALFPTDPMGSWNQPPSTSGMIHFTAANLAFLSITLAALLMTPILVNRLRWTKMKKYMMLGVILIVIAYLALTVSTVSIFVSHGPPLYFGLTERLHMFISVCWISIASIGLLNGRKDDSKPTV